VIYYTEPDDWRDLQEKVCAVLRVSGLGAEVERTIETVRGKVEIDFYAVDSTVSPTLKYLCECKYWRSAVPKSVVHSFRTVVSDYGAHVGFIISRNGFQSGSYEAAQNSNIHLVNWFEFQELFIERWIEGRYSILKQAFEDLSEFYDYLSAPIGNAISGSEERMNEYNTLLKRFAPQADLNPWVQMVSRKEYPPEFPHRVMEIDADGTETELEFTDCATLFDWHESRTQLGLKEFAQFVQRYRTGPVGT
jgi:hypothetical protein